MSATDVVTAPEETKEQAAPEMIPLPLAPSTFRLLIRMPDKVIKTKSGIYVPDATADKEKLASMIGQVVAMGPDAYFDEHRFPTGPSCHLGDYVLFRAYAGTAIRFGYGDYRLINDDSVEAVVYQPEGISR